MRTKKKVAPAPRKATHQLAKADPEFTRMLGLRHHEPLTVEDREDLDLLIRAAERGFRMAIRCTVCGHWVSSPASVRAHMGPVCRAKSVAE